MKIQRCCTLVIWVVASALVLMSGCSNSECTSGDTIPASMARLGIPAVEGASVCRASDKLVTFIHHDRDAAQLMTAYTDKLKHSGWTASAKQSKEPGYESYEKGGNKVMVNARRCASPSLTEYFGNCTIVDIWDDTE